jgi:hypothetical protein
MFWILSIVPSWFFCFFGSILGIGLLNASLDINQRSNVSLYKEDNPNVRSVVTTAVTTNVNRPGDRGH